MLARYDILSAAGEVIASTRQMDKSGRPSEEAKANAALIAAAPELLTALKALSAAWEQFSEAAADTELKLGAAFAAMQAKEANQQARDAIVKALAAPAREGEAG